MLEREDGEKTQDAAFSAAIEKAFARGSGHGLLQLGTTAQSGSAFPPALAWWRDFGARYVTALRALPNTPEAVPLPPDSILSTLVDEAPPMKGSEYLTAGVLKALWANLDAALSIELSESALSVEAFLKQRNPAWNVVGRVHFNLAENRKDEIWPFAFLATYTTGLSAQGQAKHLPLGQALREFAGDANKPQPAEPAASRATSQRILRVVEAHG